jgi:MEMO1 family protein
MVEKYPKLRGDLHFQHVQHEGARVLLIQDPLGIMPDAIGISEILTHVLPLLDGTREVAEIEALFEEALPGEVPEGLIPEGIFGLEKAGIFESAAYWKKRKEFLDTYSLLETRSHSHADLAYEGNQRDLTDWLDTLLSGPNGTIHGQPRVIVAPHIDFRVNTSVYAKAYHPLKGHQFDRVVLMGTGHSVVDGVYCLTHKNLATPLGVTPNDRSSVEKIQNAGAHLLAPNDFPHRDEHALEFQMIFLQRLLGVENFEVVPILCGSVDCFQNRYSRLGQVSEMGPLLETLSDVIHENGRRTLVVAGVDFSHIGLRFSHPVAAAEMMEETHQHDRDLIDAFTKWDVESFWETEQASGGRFNVCGFSTLSTILEVVEPGEGKCLAYDIWDDSPTGSAVTFAAIVV